MCYRKQTGSKVYDMYNAQAIREDLELETVVGNITSTVIHQGKNFWVVNKFPWYAGGIHQCICTHIREVAGEEEEEKGEETYYYPIQYNWVDKMVFMGREIIGIEYIGEQREVCSRDILVLIMVQILRIYVCCDVLSSSGQGSGPRSGLDQVPGLVQKVQGLRTKDLDLG